MKVKFNDKLFAKALEQYAQRKEQQIKTGIERACIEVQGRAMEKCPKDTTELRQSIEYKVEMQNSKVTGTVGTGLDYAPYVHEGTGIKAPKGRKEDLPWSYQDERGEWHTTYGMEPTPFLLDARNESEERVVQILFDALKGQ